jgi:lysophospholipase L1-like esterase
MRIFGTILLVLTAFVNASAQTPATNLLVKDGQTVAFLGDSITGLGWARPGGFLHLVTDGLAANGVKITPLCAGVAGNRSSDMLARVDADIISKKPDWMLLSCGVNDVWSRSIDLDTFKKNITAIVDKAQAAGIKVMILPPTPINEASKNEFNDKLPGYVDFMTELAKERQLPCADVHTAYLDYLAAHADPNNPNIVTVDGVHPNADGYQLFAKTILAAFGATPDQLATADQAWRAAPINAVVFTVFVFHADAPVTGDALAALNKMAADQKVELKKIVGTAALESARDLLKTEDMSKVSPADLSDKFLAGAMERLNAWTHTPAGAPGPTTSLNAVAAFAADVPMSLPEWDALKKAAAARKDLLPHLISQSFIEAVREALVAQADLSKVWAENISGSAGSLLKPKLDAIAVKEGGWTGPPAAATASTN